MVGWAGPPAGKITTQLTEEIGFSDDDVFNTEGRVVFTIATTFPWGAE